MSPGLVLAIGAIAGALWLPPRDTLQNYSLFAALGQARPGSWFQESLKALTPEVREAIERRLRRRDAYEVRTPIPEAAAFELKVAAGRRQEIERGIVTLIDRPGVEAEAVAFASSAKVYYEWETEPAAPLAEAASAAAYLNAHPATMIEPYLRLFELHRYRSGFEAAVFMVAHPYPEVLGAENIARWKKRHDAMRSDAAAAYGAAWEVLRASTDIVVRALADDLDGKPYLYLNVGAHPRRSTPETQQQDRDAAAIAAAKATIVRDIESTLPAVTFEVWLRDVVGPQAVIKWNVNDCGEQTGNPAQDKGRDFPMCAEAEVGLAGDRKLYVMLVVGTFRRGVGPGSPKLWAAVIAKAGEDPKFIDRLAQVPAVIK